MNSTRHEQFRAYVTDRRPALLRMALRLTGDRADAEDLLQAALAKTYLAWDRIHDRGAVDGYVRRAMVNTQISWWRRRKLEVYPTGEVPDRPVDDHTRHTELRDVLGRALRRLPERQRLTVMLRYYEDMSEAEIAHALGVTVGTVKSTVSRAMARLRDDAVLGEDFPQAPQRQWRTPVTSGEGNAAERRQG
ncbi:SigE family RNA polymerase sigma factor [Spirillospora albida]|uniref:SigE family RNA polymerase sigma factor n=1 Tax=Spirillospora albida TaxID=58123 RepID=UPI0009FC4B1A|nr:SigE family RNA polymerase sigma factor [Spirillospora albida]